jgi:hypothetical protein
LEVRAIVTGPIDPRKVHWYWEKNGNVGKTWITKYLAVHEDVCFLSDSGSFLTMGSNVIIFANFAPNQSKISSDRWIIREI